MQMDNLRELYIDELKDLYNAEKQLLKALPKMAKNATSPQLQQAFTDHLAQTEGQVERLEQIFESLGESPKGKRCVGMEGLIEEANELLEEDAQEDVLDAGLISKAQHVEHYEIAGYGTCRAYALTLGETEHATLLQETLREEEAADKLLTSLAERSINIDAAIGDEEGEEEEERVGEREVRRGVAREGGPNGGRKSAGTRRSGKTKSAETRAR